MQTNSHAQENLPFNYFPNLYPYQYTYPHEYYYYPPGNYHFPNNDMTVEPQRCPYYHMEQRSSIPPLIDYSNNVPTTFPLSSSSGGNPTNIDQTPPYSMSLPSEYSVPHNSFCVCTGKATSISFLKDH